MRKIEEPIILIDYLINIEKIQRKKAKMLLTKGLVFVNNKKETKYNYPLLPNSIVDIRGYNIKAMEKSDIEIIYEDKNIIVVNKPSGLLTISTNNEKEKTMYHKVSDYVKKINIKNKIFIIHRLDKDTSGLIIFAKNEKIKKKYQENWEQLVTYRGYTAIVEGRPYKPQDKIVNYLAENKNTMKMYSTSKDKGKKSITNYKTLKTNKNYAMLDINLETGRKNQIRVCMKDMNCPILGDKKYGSKTNPIKRMALHSHKLSIIYPTEKSTITFVAEIPDSFNKLIK